MNNYKLNYKNGMLLQAELMKGDSFALHPSSFAPSGTRNRELRRAFCQGYGERNARPRFLPEGRSGGGSSPAPQETGSAAVFLSSPLESSQNPGGEFASSLALRLNCLM